MFWQNSSLTEPLLFWNKKDSVFLSKPARCLQAKEVIYPILDLKTPNVFIWAKHFHVETVRLVIASLCRGDLLASVDIKDACLYIPYFLCVNPTSLLAFFFGLSIAPWGFTKVFALVLTLLCLQGIPMMGYLDKRLSSSPCRPCLPVLHQAVWEGESWTPLFHAGAWCWKKVPSQLIYWSDLVISSLLEPATAESSYPDSDGQHHCSVVVQQSLERNHKSCSSEMMTRFWFC